MSVYNSYTDSELATLLIQDDRAAFAEIYERYWSILLNHALKMLGSEDEAKDVIQDVFSTLWQKRTTLEIHTSLASFLYISVRYQVLKVIRHSKVAERYLSTLQRNIEEGLPATDLPQERELAKRIEDGIRQLPPRMKEVFELSRIHGYSYREIAEKLDLADNTVKRQVSNALKILRIRLNQLLFFFL